MTLLYRPCVGIALINADGRVFAGLRKGTKDGWQMPQGGIDAGEDLHEAALRELEEETSVPASAVEILAETPRWLVYDFPTEVQGKRWKGKYRGQQQKWLLMRFTGTDAQINIATPKPEFSEWRWMLMKSVQKKIIAFKRPVYDAVAKEFAPYLAQKK